MKLHMGLGPRLARGPNAAFKHVARAGFRRTLLCGASGLCLALIALPVASTPARAQMSGGDGGSTDNFIASRGLGGAFGENGGAGTGNGGGGGDGANLMSHTAGDTSASGGAGSIGREALFGVGNVTSIYSPSLGLTSGNGADSLMGSGTGSGFMPCARVYRLIWCRNG